MSGSASLAALKLTAYRNYAALALTLDERSVVLVGPNGAGKTNLLEAISFLSPGRGLRRADLGDVGRRPGDGSWAVAATVVNGAGTVELGTGLGMTPDGPESQRRVRVNHAPARSSDALLEHLRVAWLTPSMDGLFTGPASDRRARARRCLAGRHRARDGRARHRHCRGPTGMGKPHHGTDPPERGVAVSCGGDRPVRDARSRTRSSKRRGG